MRELLGIIVLSMPILAVICIGGLAGYAGWAAARRVEGANKKWVARFVAALAVIVIFVGDEIVGRLYFLYLCATGTEVKVFKRAELPSQYWDSNDVPRSRFVQEGSLFLLRFGDQFELDHQNVKGYVGMLGIDRDRLSIRDLSSNAVLSEMHAFRYWGGWLVTNVSLDVSAIHCPAEVTFKEFYRATFVKKAD